jgi:hypothetical protein
LRKKSGFIASGKARGIKEGFTNTEIDGIMKVIEPIDNALMIGRRWILRFIFHKMEFTVGTRNIGFHGSKNIEPKRGIITEFCESMKNFPEGSTPYRSIRIIGRRCRSRLKKSGSAITSSNRGENRNRRCRNRRRWCRSRNNAWIRNPRSSNTTCNRTGRNSTVITTTHDFY